MAFLGRAVGSGVVTLPPEKSTTNSNFAPLPSVIIPLIDWMSILDRLPKAIKIRFILWANSCSVIVPHSLKRHSYSAQRIRCLQQSGRFYRKITAVERAAALKLQPKGPAMRQVTETPQNQACASVPALRPLASHHERLDDAVDASDGKLLFKAARIISAKSCLDSLAMFQVAKGKVLVRHAFNPGVFNPKHDILPV